MSNGSHIVLVQLKGRKTWNYLKSNGDLSRNKIHAVVYPSEESAQAEVKNINTNYAEYYTAKAGMLK